MSPLSRHATVLIPTHDHGPTLRYALDSLKWQTFPDFEAYIIGDGVPEALKPTVGALVAKDGRFHYLDNPKHVRRGEPYRHEALLRARDGFVCYLCDRDIWLPEHLEQIWALLQSADFSHSLPVHILPDGGYRAFPVDLSYDLYRHIMCTLADNRIPFSCFAHRLDAYRRLADGWTTTPEGQWTDLHMFRKFFADHRLRGVSGLSPTAATLPSPPRKDWTGMQRLTELESWWRRLGDAAGRAEFAQTALKATIHAQRAELALMSRHAHQLQRQLALCQPSETRG